MPSTVRPARRMPPAERREQLVRAAVSVVAERGYSDFPLELIAERADVTRNLLYHYFPAGRRDIFAAVAQWAGREMADGWVSDPEVPLDERIRRNFEHVFGHVSGPTDTWRLYRDARALSDPEVAGAVERYTEAMIEAIARNQLGAGVEPTPLLLVALHGYWAFGEEVLERALAEGIPKEQVFALVTEILANTIASTRG